MAERRVKKPEKRKTGFDNKYRTLIILIFVIAAFGIILIWFAVPKFSDNVEAEFGEYTSSLGFGNNYFGSACSEGQYVTGFYTMSGVSGRLTKIIVPVEVQDDPDARAVGDIKICEANLGSECVGDETTIVSTFDFSRIWGFDSGEKEIDITTPFYVRAGAYYKITIEGVMSKSVTYSMYKADVPTGINRYFHTAEGCSSARPDVYVIHFWAV